MKLRSAHFGVLIVSAGLGMAVARVAPQLGGYVPPELGGEPLSPVVLHQEANRTIVVRNPHLWRSMRVSGVSASCGCMQVEARDFMLKPRGTYVLPVRVRATEMAIRQETVLWVEMPDREPVGLALSIGVVPPVPGWPDEARAELDRGAGTITVRIAPEYRDAVSAPAVYAIGSDVGVPGEFASDRSDVVFRGIDPDAGGLEMAMDVSGVRWCGPLRIDGSFDGKE